MPSLRRSPMLSLKPQIKEIYCDTIAVMGTSASIQVVGHGSNAEPRGYCRRAVEKALEWFKQVEERCTRFDPSSELRLLTEQVGVPIAVSDILFQVTQFALAVA